MCDVGVFWYTENVVYDVQIPEITSVFKLETPRLLLISTPLDVLQQRLATDHFTTNVLVDGHAMRVTFPSEWPGDALVLFPLMIERLEQDPDMPEWGGTVIDRTERVAVGQMGFKGLPDAHGHIELGYGINASYQNRGYATEMARALVAWALTQPNVHTVTAECLEDNDGSIRVLEKIGFERVGQRMDEEGLLILWAYDVAAPC